MRGATGEVAVPRRGSAQRNMLVRVVRRFHFTSELKRMSAVVSLDHHTPAPLLAVSKVPFLLKNFTNVRALTIRCSGCTRSDETLL